MEIQKLVQELEKTQYSYKKIEPPKTKIITKYDLQKIKIPDNVQVSRTSGSTGIPVVVPKTRDSVIWYTATNLRELQWRQWDLNLKKVSILARNKVDEVRGKTFIKKLAPILELQKYLETVQPDYLYTYPSIVNLLDLSKLYNLKDIKTVGETGATSYSSEETGTIALQCPDNKDVYHVMENIIVESDPVYGAVITDLTNPVITRYALGDIIELDDELCKCGRTLPVIKKIYGRSRNMLRLANGDRIWPTIGEPLFCTITNKIIRHQAIQKDLNNVEINLQVSDKLTDSEESALKSLVIKSLGFDHIECSIKYVEGFPMGKFEAFVSFL